MNFVFDMIAMWILYCASTFLFITGVRGLVNSLSLLHLTSLAFFQLSLILCIGLWSF